MRSSFSQDLWTILSKCGHGEAGGGAKPGWEGLGIT